MTRYFAGACALVIAMLGALPSQTRAADDRTLPMRFELRQQTGACGDTCRSWISASGAITADAARDFLKFAEGRDLRGALMALDSDGGSVLGAMALGREIRKRGITTTVGRTIETRESNATRVALSPRADCGSMCVFVLLGGAQRMVPSEARVLVHQIWLGDRRDDPTAANYSAEDLVLVQRDIGRLAQYTIEMGASIDLLDIALRIPPWEPMHMLSRAELRDVKLDNGADAVAATTVAIAAQSKAVALPASAVLGAVNQTGERRWVMAGGNGASLARSHPLTIEGDEVGSFDLTVACGNEGYLVSYSETRRAAGQWALPLALKTVTVRVGGQLATLKISSSERRSSSSELVTSASGMVPAALIDAFAAAAHRTMLVETTSDQTNTAIRVGNTGAMQNLPKVAGSCQKPPADRADLAMKKTGGQAPAQ